MATRRRVQRIQVLAKSAFFRKCVGLARLADIRQAVLRGLARLAKICQVVARTCQTRERQFWQVLCEFSESSESGKFDECRLDHFMLIKYVICAKNDLSYHCACTNIRQEAWRVLARLADIRQAVLRGLARLADIRRAVLSRLAKLANIRQTIYRALARKM